MALVEVRNLVKHFERGGGLLRAKTVVRAVDGVSFSIEEGETFGLVGESGSGKSTTGRCMLRLIEPTSGEVRFRGENVLAFDRGRMRAARRDMQMVFQDPVLVAQSAHAGARDRRGAAGHPPASARAPSAARRWPNCSRSSASTPTTSSATRTSSAAGSGSGSAWPGRWRCNPSFIIADEPVSALDVSIQAQVINLLIDLQQRLKLTYLFIAHDLRLVRHICTRRRGDVPRARSSRSARPAASLPIPATPTRGRCCRRSRSPTRCAAAADRARSRPGQSRRPAARGRSRPFRGGVGPRPATRRLDGWTGAARTTRERAVRSTRRPAAAARRRARRCRRGSRSHGGRASRCRLRG